MGLSPAKITIDQIKEEVPGAEDSETEQATEEYAAFAKKESLVLTIKRLSLENEDLRQSIDLRRKHAGTISKLVFWWLGIALSLIVISAFFNYFESPVLSEKVLIALITGTTASVIGLYAIIIKGIFGRK